MNKKRREHIQNILDERFEIALDTEKRMHNDSSTFLPNNPDFIYYKAMCNLLVEMGYCWERKWDETTKRAHHYIEREVL